MGKNTIEGYMQINLFDPTGSKYAFLLVKDDYSTVVTPDTIHRYLDLDTMMLYLWDGKEYRDASFYQGYQYSRYDQVERIQQNYIYLAQPGHRILGRINGIQDDSCSLKTALNNTTTLSFTVNRMIDGEEVQFYDQIDRLYELYIPDFGWFKINEQPQIENDGTQETKTVNAESLEIELQQYDLVDFIINSGALESREQMATDNVYKEGEYTIARDSVLFYRDTRKLEKAIEEFKDTDGSVAALKTFAETHTELIYRKDLKTGVSDGCWRITRDEDGEIQIDDVNHDNEDRITELDNEYTTLIGQKETVQKSIDSVEYKYQTGEITEEEYLSQMESLNKNMQLVDEQIDDVLSERDELSQDLTYTGTEILDLELQREHDLSLMWLVLSEHDWEIGFVDPTVDLDSDNDMDRIPLAQRIKELEIDSQDIYSFLTQEVSSKYRCIFVFDTENYRINAYSLNNVGFDTNIYLSFRNIQNQITRSSDRELYTVLHVRGNEDLDFTEVNFGQDSISDISHFLNTDHFSQEFIDKYNYWLQYREGKRDEYKELSVAYREANNKASEIYNRVPIDNIEGKQYSTMKEDELLEERGRMEAIKRGIEAEFTDEDGNIDWDALMKSDDWGTYDQVTHFILSDPLDALDFVILVEYVDPEDGKTKIKYDFDYDAYYEKHGEHFEPPMRLGDIDIALYNQRVVNGYYTTSEMTDKEKRARTSPKIQADYLDSYMYDFETYGYLYGVAELEAQLASLTNSYNSMKTNGYDDTDGSIYDVKTYEQFLKYEKAMHQCEAALAERKVEYNVACDEVDAVQKQRQEIVDDVAITNEQFGFTAEELALLDKYYVHTDYTNEDILITNISTSEEIIEAEYQLYLDAVDQLYVESHPQYQWNTTQDNLLLIPQFQDWHGQLHVGNFIWVSFRDDYQIKLRVSAITMNPFMTEPDISIEFTSMVSYKSRRNDYADLLASSNASMKNSISTAISLSNKEDAINIDTALVMRLLNSQAFSGYMNSNNQNITGSTFIIASDVVQAAYINVGKIVGTRAEFEQMYVNYLRANVISSAKMIASEITVGDLRAHKATADLIVLMTQDGDVTHPSIAFRDSTQQFYDAYGNVRIQIGQDGNGNFNFVIKGEDGQSILFDENGITKNGIPDNTIINNMIENETIEEGKLTIPLAYKINNSKVKTNHLLFSEEDGLIVHQNQFEIFTALDIDPQTSNIRLTGDGMGIYVGQDQYAEYGQDIILGRGHYLPYNNDYGNVHITANDGVSIYRGHTQVANYSDTITIGTGENPAFYVDTDGNGTFSGSIIADDGTIGGWHITDKSIYCGTEEAPLFPKEGDITLMGDGTFNSFIGGFYELGNEYKFIIGDGFGVESDGTVHMAKALIGGSNLEYSKYLNVGNIYADAAIYYGVEDFEDTDHDGIYFGTNGILLGKGKFKVTTAGELTATSGTIGGWNIDSNSIYSGTKDTGTGDGNITLRSSGTFTRTIGGTSRSALRFAIGSNFAVSQSGAIYATSGNIGGCTFNNSGQLQVDSANISSLNADKISGGTISASEIKLGSGKFYVTTAGALTSTSGTIGGWNIDSKSIYYGTSYTSTANNAVTLMSNDVFSRSIGGKSRSSLKFAIGANFAVDNTGKLYASSGEFNGSMNFTYGSSGTISINDSSKSAPIYMVIDIPEEVHKEELKITTSEISIKYSGLSSDNSSSKFDRFGLTMSGSYSAEYLNDQMQLYSSGMTVTASSYSIKVFHNNDGMTMTYDGISIVRNGESFRVPWSSSGKNSAYVSNFHTVNTTEGVGAWLYVGTTDGVGYGIAFDASDISLKKDVQDTKISALSTINKIQHREFVWKQSDTKQELGYVAQELRDIIPNSTFAVEQGDGTEVLQIRDFAIVPYITKAIQELSSKVDYLEKENDELKKIIKDLGSGNTEAKKEDL